VQGCRFDEGSWSLARQSSRRSRPRVRNERQGREVAHVAARGGLNLRAKRVRAPVRNWRGRSQTKTLGAAALPHAPRFVKTSQDKPTTRRRKRRRRSSRLPASPSRCRTARKSVRPVSSSSRRPSPKTPPRKRRPASRGSRGSRRRVASPVAEMPRRVSASSSPARGGFGPECHEKKNGRPFWTPLESTTNDSRSLSTSETGYLAALTRHSGHAPGSALPRLAALARLAPLALLLLLAAGRGSEQGRRWAAPVDARHAGRVPALPPPAWARSSVAPPERRGEAGCPGRRSRDDGGSRRPVRSARLLVFVFGGAREILSSKRRSRLSAFTVEPVAPRTGRRRASRFGVEGVQSAERPLLVLGACLNGSNE